MKKEFLCQGSLFNFIPKTIIICNHPHVSPGENCGAGTEAVVLKTPNVLVENGGSHPPVHSCATGD